MEDRVGPVQWLRDGFGLGPGPEFEGYPRYRVLENQTLGKFLEIINSSILLCELSFRFVCCCWTLSHSV